MKFIQFKQKLDNFISFDLPEIRKIEPGFDSRRLNEWQKKGYIKKIRRGHYIFSDKQIIEPVLFLIANKIYSPSYISLEMAFSYYNLIPESVYGITSITSQKTNSFKTPVGDFLYRHIKPDLIFGYNLVKFKNFAFKIADVEKTILDFLYLTPNLKTENDFFELRINATELKTILDEKRMMIYLKRFNCKALSKRINKFMNFFYHA